MKSKKFLSWLLVLAMVLSLLPATSLTAYAGGTITHTTECGPDVRCQDGQWTCGTHSLQVGDKIAAGMQAELYEGAYTVTINGNPCSNHETFTKELTVVFAGSDILRLSTDGNDPKAPKGERFDECTCTLHDGAEHLYIYGVYNFSEEVNAGNVYAYQYYEEDGEFILDNYNLPLCPKELTDCDDHWPDLIGWYYYDGQRDCWAKCEGTHGSAATTPLTFTAEEANSTITFDWASGTDVKYSTDGTEWNDYTAGTAITLAKVDDTVSFKGTNVTTSNQKHFVMTGKIAASGDVTSLTNGTGGDATLPVSSCNSMFYGCTALTAAPELPATELANSCYALMFRGCTALTEAPELPATAMAQNCYNSMFYGCTALTTAPTLPAESLAKGCYEKMFYECKKLATAPALPAKELAESCYYSMFQGCTSLTSAPELPATTLTKQCYQGMFNGCEKLTTAPALPASALAQGCYDSMFRSCTALTAAPELKVEAMEPKCYQNMFYGCTALTAAPELKATTLASGCYNSMFKNCTGLKVVETSNASEATWIFPATSASSWNTGMISGLKATGTVTSVAAEKMYKVTAALTKLTVTMGETSQQYAYGAKVVKPADPTKTGYTFGGWYSDEECTQAWNFAIDTVKDDMNLYPKWIRNYVPITTIGGKVFTGEQGDTPVSDATVELYLGTEKVAATVTGGDGSYIFDKVEKGTYNIVVTKGDKIKTELVTINDSSATVNVVLPTSEINSKVEHKGTEVPDAKSDISKTVVGDLDAVADANAEEGRKVTVKLTVEPKADTNTPAQTSIKNLPEASGKKVEFLDLSLIKETQGEDDENIGDDNTQILTIVIPFDFSGVNVSSVTILRQHGTDNAEPLKKNPAAGQEGFTVNAAEGTITIYAMKFSDYAVAYSNASHGGGSYTPGHTVTSDLKSVTKVTIDGKVVDSRYYTVSSGTVYLTGEFMKTLANGKHTVKLYDGLKVATGTITVTGNTNVASAATGDVGIALYGVLTISSLLGIGWVGRKKRGE